jgi:hypothetical protein
VRSWKAEPAKKREYKTRLQAAAGPPRAGPGEAHGARDRGGVHRRARAAAIAARSRAGRNSAIDRDHRRRRIRWGGSRRRAGDSKATMLLPYLVALPLVRQIRAEGERARGL